MTERQNTERQKYEKTMKTTQKACRRIPMKKYERLKINKDEKTEKQKDKKTKDDEPDSENI